MLHMERQAGSCGERRSVPCGTKTRHSRRKFYCCLRADSDSDARESPEKKPSVAAVVGRSAPAQACDIDWQPLSPRLLSSSPDRSGYRTERVMEAGDVEPGSRCTGTDAAMSDCALTRTLADTTLETSLDTVQWHTPSDEQASPAPSTGCPFSRLTREHIVSPPSPGGEAKGAGEGDASAAGTRPLPSSPHERKMSRSELLPSDATRRVSSESGLGPDLRRTSSESDSEPRKVSSDSWGDVDASSTRKPLNLASLVEGVGALIMPSQNFMTLALRRLLMSWGLEKWEAIRSNLGLQDDQCYYNGIEDISCTRSTAAYDPRLINKLVDIAPDMIGVDSPTLMKNFGSEFFRLCDQEYGYILRSLGATLHDFLSNFDSLHEQFKAHPIYSTRTPPSLRCIPRDDCSLVLSYASQSGDLEMFMVGLLQEASQQMYNVSVTVSLTQPWDKSAQLCLYIIEPRERKRSIGKTCNRATDMSLKPADSKISTQLFCRTFPFHFMFDRELKIQQLGIALQRNLPPTIGLAGLKVTNTFEFTRPLMSKDDVTFEGMLARTNLLFVLRTCVTSNKVDNIVEGTELKGQMLYLKETDCMLFLGSPRVNKLEEMMGRGIYISDVPIHDATRDLVLVGEQAKAQDGLKKRMDKLRAQLEEAHIALEEEKQKNVDLLYAIFPPAIARRLWLGQSVPSRRIENVTMLFSDIVGFTAICSSCTPMQVINMLNDLYTRFDIHCGALDVYKVETIGDAYCVACGLHKTSLTHAQRNAFMAIKMMESAEQVCSPDGTPIRMRIGLHTGTVLAGTVGQKMPRYCLFGNNVALANKFESTSFPLKINVSPTTYSYLIKSKGFHFTPRSREELPEGFPSDVPGICHFLEKYDVQPADDVEEDLQEPNLYMRSETTRRTDVTIQVGAESPSLLSK
ncbi:guanylate cyclase soluble subunit alpha-1-like [Branchiostoma lanceolatum]|uniref:guanylate cyclase soluble subunit alpha-1-like n=1 Tax=Branchiostoma lanceolatum TaxID=7740 RepID=UPI003452787A